VATDRLRDQAVGAVLKRLREGDGGRRAPLTQRELAQAIGLTGPGGPVSISRFESGTVHVPRTRLDALAEALGTTATVVDAEADELAEQARRNAPEPGGGAASGLARRVRTELAGGAAVQENYLHRLAIDEEVADRRERTEALLERLHDAQQELAEGVLKPFAEYAAGLDLRIPAAVPHVTDDDSPRSSHDARYATTKDLVRGQIQRSLSSTHLGNDVGAAAAVGSGTAAIFAWMAVSATASGKAAAIASPAEAATGSATLAWLGTGPLAAGELGLAGGALVMGSIVMLPALVAAGGVVAYHSHRVRQHAAEESERLDLAEQELAATAEMLEATWQTIVRTRTVCDELTTIGLREVRWLGRETGGLAVGPVTQTLDRRRFDSLSDLVVTAALVLGLPILRDLQPDAIDDPDRAERAQWVHFVLDQATAQALAYPRFAADRPGTK
jgi:transcriptional regulator with XRE-family HTH domain